MTSSATHDGDRGGKAAGAFLREAREVQGLAVADVARQLKLSTSQVEALEAGEFGRLPGPVFVRGFVRNYARLLKLDADPLLQAAASDLPREDPLPAPPSVEVPFPTAAPRRWHLYAGAAAIIVAALAAYEFLPTASEPAATESTAAAPAPSVKPNPDGVTDVAATPSSPSGSAGSEQGGGTGVARTATEESSARRIEPPPQVASDAGERSQGATQLAGAIPAAAEPAPGAAKNFAREEETVPGSGERQVHMVFDQASWVEIRDRSGKAIFSQLNARGTEQRVNGLPPLAVVVGNAHGVRLTYDERPVNLMLHTKIDVARLTLQ